MQLGWPTWIGVVVDDLEAQADFYRGLLGRKESASGPGWVHFDIEGNLFEILQREDGSPQYQRPRFQVGFTVQDIESAREELMARGAEPISEIEGGPKSGNRWCYFRDPEGNVFEITQWLDRRHD